MLKFKEDEVVFWSDTHWGHGNIIKYCQRPFMTLYEMNKLLIENYVAVEGKVRIHLGDIGFNLDMFEPYKPTSTDDICVMGNHDNMKRLGENYKSMFRGGIIGTPTTWKFNHEIIELTLNDGTIKKILISHNPMSDLRGCDYNFYGHFHNNMFLNPDMFRGTYDFVFTSTQHYNLSVELTNYKLLSFSEIMNPENNQRCYALSEK